jgi:hypothetical protein
VELTIDNATYKSKIVNRFKSMYFLCTQCVNPTPLNMSDIGIDEGGVAAFGICPNYSNKFIVKIEDYGKVR